MGKQKLTAEQKEQLISIARRFGVKVDEGEETTEPAEEEVIQEEMAEFENVDDFQPMDMVRMNSKRL